MDYKEMTRASLQDCLDRVLQTYMTLYDMEHSSNDKEAIFLKETIDLIDTLTSPAYVYARDKYINEGYVLEKLKRVRNNLDWTIKYYEEKLKNKEKIEE